MVTRVTYRDYSDPPVPMTEEQRFFFDLRGWLVLPSVLTSEELESMRAECYAGVDALESRPGGVKDGYSGVLQTLLDHPAIVGILSAILSDTPFDRDTAYGFRCEDSHVIMRPPGWSRTARGDGGSPHVVHPPQRANAMRYQVAGGKIFSGLTRLVWELEEVKAGQGGTSFLSGSHKAHFGWGGPAPTAGTSRDSPFADSIRSAMDTYSCPAGSVIIFTESLLHAANDWTNPDNGRCAVFQCYNSVMAQFHRTNIMPEDVANMPPKRRSLFRGVWELGGNTEYSDDNRGSMDPSRKHTVTV